MGWNLERARAILPEVRRLTGDAVARVEALTERRREELGPAEQVEVEQELARVVSVWIRGMEALGVDVKGAWLVDFDTGSGCYCWRWPEEQLEYFHGYDEGFTGRVRIQ
jgi:hypothetical protein